MANKAVVINTNACLSAQSPPLPPPMYPPAFASSLASYPGPLQGAWVYTRLLATGYIQGYLLPYCPATKTNRHLYPLIIHEA